MLSPSVNEYLVVPPGDVQFIEKVEAGGYGEVWKGKWKGKGGGVIVTIRKVPVIRVPARQQRAILMEVGIYFSFSFFSFSFVSISIFIFTCTPTCFSLVHSPPVCF